MAQILAAPIWEASLWILSLAASITAWAECIDIHPVSGAMQKRPTLESGSFHVRALDGTHKIIKRARFYAMQDRKR